MVNVMYPCMFCVALPIDLFVLCFVLLNVMELLSVVGGALLDIPCMVFQVCVVPVVPVSV